MEYDRYGGGSVIVWDCISLEGRTDLQVIDIGSITDVRNRAEVLQLIMRSFACAVRPDFIPLQDNARAHI